MTSLPSDFFRFNETDYDFPHGDCDLQTSAALQTHFFRDDYLCGRILRHYNSSGYDASMRAARAHRGLAICGEAFMRVKFALEVMNLRTLLRKVIPAMKKPTSPFMKEPVSQIWAWEAHGTEHYAQVDVVANRLFLYILQTLKDIAMGVDEADAENAAWIAARMPLFETMNTAIQKIRAKPCGSILWERFIPYELCAYAYFMFLLELWGVVRQVL